MTPQDPEAIVRLLGLALARIRTRSVGTQEGWEDVTGMSQSYLSKLERGKGLVSVTSIAEHIARVGVDPVEWLREAVALGAELPPEETRLLHLWADQDRAIKDAVLAILERPTAQKRETS